MLHEILLALAGGPSPLLSVPPSKADSTHSETTGPLQSLLSQSERALLQSLAEDLGQRNKDIRAATAIISASHPSIVCRALSTAIVSTHLATFQQKILAVEKDILEENACIVGAYNIVPLSALVGAFDGWPRRLDWLWNLVQFIQAPRGTRKTCTAAAVIGRLRDAVHTGYPDIEVIARDLVQVAEVAWLKQVSSWIFYGKYPVNGNADFFVVRQADDSTQSSSADVYAINDSLVPQFVSKPTAQSILFIGKSLNQIRERQSGTSFASAEALAPNMSLLPAHIAHLSSLDYPLNPPSFTAAIRAIRQSLSNNALQKLLPLSKVYQMLHILKDFFLLGRGEFAVALITAAEDRLSARYNAERSKRSGSNDLASMVIQEGEVTAVLARTWTTLVSLQTLDDEDDEELDQARAMISLSIGSPGTASKESRDFKPQASKVSFDDLLLPTSTALSLRVPSPLDLVLDDSDVEVYSYINAYLLAIRRAHLRLSKLFLLSALRRAYPSPKITASHKHDASGISSRIRARSNQITKSMRSVWASIGSAVFFLAEIGEYFQGEVVQSSWLTYQSWLLPVLEHDTVPYSVGSMGNLHELKPTNLRADVDSAALPLHDPETLTQAHKNYLDCLKKALLLDNPEFTSLLRRLMTLVDHLSALMQRLNAIQQNLDWDVGNGLEDTESHYALEEQRIMSEIKSSHSRVSSSAQGLVEALRAIDAARTRGPRYRGTIGNLERGDFVPWAGDGVDRLLLRFDFGKSDEFALR